MVALVGCGGGTSTADRNAIDQAAAKTANVRTYDLATSSSFKVPGTKKRVTFRGTGAFTRAVCVG
ncbi:MAG: hypothetical protein M3R70_00300 [Actinomycetota bacterium]|nr:hypothetical protein [Actinomycetota bacterium]